MNNLDPLLSAQQLADYLEVPLATLYAWRHRGEGPPGFRAGKHLRYRWSDIDRWIHHRMASSVPSTTGGDPRDDGRAQGDR